MVFLKAIAAVAALAVFYSIWAAAARASELPVLPPGTAVESAITADSLPQTVCLGSYFKEKINVPLRFQGASGIPPRQRCKYDYPDLRPEYYGQIRFVPRGNGNNPSDPRNLWHKPPPVDAWEAGKKAQPKLFSSRMVCNEKITFTELLRAISSNWIEAWKKLCVVQITFPWSL